MKKIGEKQNWMMLLVMSLLLGDLFNATSKLTVVISLIILIYIEIRKTKIKNKTPKPGEIIQFLFIQQLDMDKRKKFFIVYEIDGSIYQYIEKRNILEWDIRIRKKYILSKNGIYQKI